MHPRGKIKRIATATALLALTVGAAVATGAGGAGRGAAERPNVIVIVTDDQDEGSFTRKLMPNTFRLMDGGTRLTNFTVATPLCCPSRAAQLTGQYGHNNGVLTNHPGYRRLVRPDNVLPAWLREAGYRTAHVGRFLNGFRRGGQGDPAPGWDRWVGLMNLHYRDYALSVEGDLRTVRGTSPRRYATRDLHRRGNRILRSLIGTGDPFYLQFDELAPHSDHLARGTCAYSALPGPLGFSAIRGADGVHVPRDPSGERSVADKPSFIRALDPIGAAERAGIQRRMRCRAAAIAEADRGIGRMVRLLRAQGVLDETAFVFYSDNGFFDGQHRIVKSKGLPYEESIQVPAMIRVPDAYLDSPGPLRTDLPTSNIDVAPTVLDLADAQPCLEPGDCRRIDGRSMLDALEGDPSWSPERPILIEVDQFGDVAGGTLACTWAGVRVGEQVYVEYERVVRRGERRCGPTNEAEHYRLDADPGQKHNLWPPRESADADAQADLAATLEELRDCEGNDDLSPALQPAGPGPGIACQ